jgi:hypothetical protein
MFNLLGSSSLGEQAAAEAASADVVIMSVSGDSDFSPSTHSWMNRWLGRKGDRPVMFGVLVDPKHAEKGAENPSIASARKFAGLAGADFIWGSSESVDGPAEAATVPA